MNMNIFHLLEEVVGRNSETQLQVGETRVSSDVTTLHRIVEVVMHILKIFCIFKYIYIYHDNAALFDFRCR